MVLCKRASPGLNETAFSKSKNASSFFPDCAKVRALHGAPVAKMNLRSQDSNDR